MSALDGFRLALFAVFGLVFGSFLTVMVHRLPRRESIVAPISGGTSQIQRNAIARTMGLRGY